MSQGVYVLEDEGPEGQCPRGICPWGKWPGVMS